MKLAWYGQDSRGGCGLRWVAFGIPELPVLDIKSLAQNFGKVAIQDRHKAPHVERYEYCELGYGLKIHKAALRDASEGKMSLEPDATKISSEVKSLAGVFIQNGGQCRECTQHGEPEPCHRPLDGYYNALFCQDVNQVRNWF